MCKLRSFLLCFVGLWLNEICEIFGDDESVVLDQTNENSDRMNSTPIVGFDEDMLITGQKIGLFLFTQYCGPGDRVWREMPRPHQWNNNGRTYGEIDGCCKQHDECPNYVEDEEQHSKYPGLVIKAQMFARLQCSCDGGFYQCLSRLGSRYANVVALGYGLVQHYCFELEHPILSCSKYSTGVFGTHRCEEYIVDKSQPKLWQWFDLPPAYRKIYNFPRIKPN